MHVNVTDGNHLTHSFKATMCRITIKQKRIRFIKMCLVFFLQLILCERTTRLFLADTGKKILSSIIVKAQKVRLKQ